MLTAATVRMVKGAAASIILLLLIEPTGGNQDWLKRYTGYSDKTVSEALAFLIENGQIIRTGDRGVYSYRLASGVTQLPLSAEQLEESEIEESEIEALPEPETEPEPEPESEIESEILRLDDPLASSGFNQTLESGLIKPPAREQTETEKIRLKLEELDRHGIREPARSRLARLDYVTPRAIRYHCMTADNFGLAIYRIEHRWRVRDGWIDPTPDEDIPPEAEPAADLQLASAPVDLAAKFTAVISDLAGELSRQDYETWVRNAAPAGMQDGCLVIGTGNQMAAAWLEEHIKKRLQDGIGAAVKFEVRNA